MTDPSNPPRAEVVIVGGGYTGAAAAMQLANARGDALAITIVEPREELGRGIAYGTRDPDHRLNGPLDNHLLDPARPDDLREWCTREGVLEADPEAMAANGGTYIRRGDFGRYVDATMRALQARPGVRLRHHRATAIGLERSGARLDVLAEDGARLAADLFVI
ncbi:MAG TPA: FAD/NAD(P)-binding protein, partial [Usitatibacter sp.]